MRLRMVASPTWKAALGLALMTAIVRLLPALRLHNEGADISTYRDMAIMFLRGDDLYARHIFFPYTPYSQPIPAAMLLLAKESGWPFDFTIKLTSILADIGTTLY